jgi:hypothetical protein
MTSTTNSEPAWARLHWLLLGAIIASFVSVYIPSWFTPAPNLVVADTYSLPGLSTIITIKNVGWISAKSTLISLRTLGVRGKYVDFVDYNGRCKPYLGVSDLLPKTIECQMLNPNESIRFTLESPDFDALFVKIVTDGRSSPVLVYGYKNGKLRKLP